MKIVPLRRSRQREICLKCLSCGKSRNLYLYEGITLGNVLHQNYCVLHGGRLYGVLHTKRGFHIHLFLSDEVDEAETEELRQIILQKFPLIRTIFGDKSTVEKLGVNLRKREFISMELEMPSFRPMFLYDAGTPSQGMAVALAPLQIEYEVEEMDVDRGEISGRLVLSVVKKRIERGEITVIIVSGKPVAFASVNARYGNTCQIGSVYVLPAYRGRGYGISIISSHVDRLFQKYKRIVLFVSKDNTRALHIYEKVGFSVKGMLEQAFFIRPPHSS
jgi:ribosomal protein S18 acetylase RimI-like enzyme